MHWLQRLPESRPAPAGREWRLFKRLPAVLACGTALPLGVAALLWASAAPQPGQAADAALWLWLYRLAGLVLLHWTLVGTLAIGCVIVMVMKGPAYVADAYPPPGREGSERESFSGAPERRVQMASDPGAKRSHGSGHGEHLQRRAGVFGRGDRA